jgi:hypothetical protein
MKILFYSLSFIFTARRLKKPVLIISHTENRREHNNTYRDLYFDRIIEHYKNTCCLIEFPKMGKYHYSHNTHLDRIVKGDFIYVLERVIHARFDRAMIESQITELSRSYKILFSGIHHDVFDEVALKAHLASKVSRNIRRLPVYRWLLHFASPKMIFLKSAYSPQSQILLYWAKKMGIKSVEVQHGHIYPLHSGYIMPVDFKGAGIFPNHIAVWSEHYKDTLIKNGWPSNRIMVTGDITSTPGTSHSTRTRDEELLAFVRERNPVITIIGQHTINEVF